MKNKKENSNTKGITDKLNNAFKQHGIQATLNYSKQLEPSYQTRGVK